MKNFLSTLIVLMLLSSGVIKAQNIITPENVTVSKLQRIFENAYFTIDKEKTNEKTLVILDTWHIYIDITKNNKCLTFSVVWGYNRGFSESEKLALVNTITTEVLLLAPSHSASYDNMMVKYDLWIEGGVTEKNIVMVEKEFKAALELMLKKDVDKIIK